MRSRRRCAPAWSNCESPRPARIAKLLRGVSPAAPLYLTVEPVERLERGPAVIQGAT